MIKLYNDFSLPHPHIQDSPTYSYLLHHNLDRLDPSTASQLNNLLLSDNAWSVGNIVQIRTKDQLSDKQSSGDRLSACVVVVKPNQPMNVACKYRLGF